MPTSTLTHNSQTTTTTTTKSQTTTKPRKRKNSRIIRSCQVCYNAHVSCDKQFPECSRCIRLGKDCQYFESFLKQKEKEAKRQRTLASSSTNNNLPIFSSTVVETIIKNQHQLTEQNRFILHQLEQHSATLGTLLQEKSSSINIDDIQFPNTTTSTTTASSSTTMITTNNYLSVGEIVPQHIYAHEKLPQGNIVQQVPNEFSQLHTIACNVYKLFSNGDINVQDQVNTYLIDVCHKTFRDQACNVFIVNDTTGLPENLTTLVTSAASRMGGFPLAVNAGVTALTGWNLSDYKAEFEAFQPGNHSMSQRKIFTPESVAVIQQIMHDYNTVKKGDHVFIKAIGKINKRGGNMIHIEGLFGFLYNQFGKLYGIVELLKNLKQNMTNFSGAPFIYSCENCRRLLEDEVSNDSHIVDIEGWTTTSQQTLMMDTTQRSLFESPQRRSPFELPF